MNTGINAINEAVQEASAFTRPLFNELGKVIVGQTYLVERLTISLLANGHVLLEGVPGLAKTLSVKSLANCLNVRFSRLQFTPDMLPADVIGTQIFNPQSGAFTTRKGPIFANLVLADEINRAPAKVQSALLEAMQEKQVTIGEQTFKLEEPFLVLATQNPIEQEGTYPPARGPTRPLHVLALPRLPRQSGGAGGGQTHDLAGIAGPHAHGDRRRPPPRSAVGPG